jgi:putative nucleotidyltransferase with HDIG domain
VRRALYRVGQFWRAVGRRPPPAAAAVLERYLTAAERHLFWSNAPRDQHHHLETLRLLCRAGAPSRELARAALLHDVGKGYIRLHERVLYVLLAAAAPRLLDRLTRRHGRGLLSALYRTRHHARLGAARLRVLGASPREVELVARHHDPPGNDLELRALVDADERA